MQRLFSTFANGLPGFGLLVQRVFTGIALLHSGISQLEAPTAGLVTPAIAGAIVGLFILVGLGTPLFGALVVGIEFWIIAVGGTNIWMSLTLAVFGGTLAMIGPGAWSADARLFGRKLIGS